MDQLSDEQIKAVFSSVEEIIRETKKGRLSWEMRHIFATQMGISSSIDEVLPIDWDDMNNPSEKIINILDGLGDISICVNQDIDAKTVLEAVNKSLMKIGFTNEAKARELFKKSLLSEKGSGWTDYMINKISQRPTSQDKPVYAYSGRSENSVVVTLKLRSFPEQLILWQLIENNKLSRLEEMLEKTLPINWISVGDISENYITLDLERLVEIAWKILNESRGLRHAGFPYPKIGETVIRTFSILEKKTPNVVEVLESKLLNIWQRLNHVTFLSGLGGDRNERIPQSVWKEEFEAVMLDTKKSSKILDKYGKIKNIPEQLVEIANYSYFPEITSDELDLAEKIIEDNLKIVE